MADKKFSVDGPLNRAVDKVINLLILNITAVVCCIPVFTIGATLAALNSVTLKMSRDLEGYVIRDFFSAFKKNFKIGTFSTLIILAVFAVAAGDVYAMSLLEAWFVKPAGVFLMCILVLFVAMLTYLFPVMAKFEAGTIDTMKNAGKFAFSHILKTLAMFALNIIPWVVCYFFNVLGPILFLYGLSVPAYLNALIYGKDFEKFEKLEEEEDAGQDF